MPIHATFDDVPPNPGLRARSGVGWSPCDERWGERRVVYHNAGHGFRTQWGIAAFGDAGGRYDDIADAPLSGGDRAKVARIRQEKRLNDCLR